MRVLRVELAERSYPILIGPELLRERNLLIPHLAGHQVLLLTNTVVAPLYAEGVERSLEGFEFARLVLPDGEQHKNLETINRVFDALLQRRFGRDCTILALGGGVVGDIGGFAAACYQRGVAYIQLPTTLLAQVDSSVGGKTGVNHALGKNMIGAFHQPRAVIADTAVLDTLPDRELSAGLAEVIKYGLMWDRGFFEWLEVNMRALRARDPLALEEAIARSCRIKADVVGADERESGQRALLNLGHTFGHAIETGMGYGSWLHGEAVGVGMYLAGLLSHRMGWLERSELHRIRALIEAAGLPVEVPAELTPTRFRELMSVDKKIQAGALRLVLLRGIGRGEVTSAFEERDLLAVLACRGVAA